MTPQGLFAPPQDAPYRKDTMDYILIVSPHPRRRGSGNALFEARLQGQERILCTSSQPFLDAAKVLIEDGIADPQDTLVMRHAGSDTISLKAKVSRAARLTVQETESRPPEFVRWRPAPLKVAAGIAETPPTGITQPRPKKRTSDATLSA
jgi:hypothetical protein